MLWTVAPSSTKSICLLEILISNTLFQNCPVLYLWTSAYMLLTALTQNETLIYNSSARGDDMKARVLKTQMLISCTIKVYTRFVKVENTHWFKQNMLHQLENAVEVPFKHKSKRTRIHCCPILFSMMAMRRLFLMGVKVRTRAKQLRCKKCERFYNYCGKEKRKNDPVIKE